jgi:hypothetical protein
MSFRSDRRGIIAPLIIGISLILTSSMLWVVSMYPVAQIWDALTPMMPREAHNIMEMLNIASGIVLLISVIGTLVWIGVWSSQKETIDIPA